jgi:hypothetical protein
MDSAAISTRDGEGALRHRRRVQGRRFVRNSRGAPDAAIGALRVASSTRSDCTSRLSFLAFSTLTRFLPNRTARARVCSGGQPSLSLCPKCELHRLDVRRNSRLATIPTRKPSTVVPAARPFRPRALRRTAPSLRETTRKDYLPAGTFDALPSLRLRKRQRHQVLRRVRCVAEAQVRELRLRERPWDQVLRRVREAAL